MIVFDLDDTLYQDKKLSQRNTELTEQWIKEELGLNKDELEILYQELQEEYPNPLRGIKSLGLSTQEYYENVFRRIEPEKHLGKKTNLEKELRVLEREKIVVSFAPEDYCWRVLETLGIDQHINNVLSASDFGLSKKKAYKNLEDVEVVVGDNFRADLKPAEELGIDIIHVSDNCKVDQSHYCVDDVVEAIRSVRQE